MRDIFLDTVENVGTWGTVLYCILFAVCVWRRYVSNNENDYPLKLIFHNFVLAAVLCDLIYYIVMWAYDDIYVVWGYCIHVLGVFLFVCAYSIVILFWAKTLNFGGDYDLVFNVVAFAIFANFCAEILVAVPVVIYTGNGLIREALLYRRTLIVVWSINIFTLLSYSFWMFGYGLRLQFRLANQMSWDGANFLKKISELLRINAVLTICTICYIIRCVCVFIVINGLLVKPAVDIADPSYFVWYLVSQWIPNMIPTCLFLYSMRAREIGRMTYSTQRETSHASDIRPSEIRPSESRATQSQYRATQSQFRNTIADRVTEVFFGNDFDDESGNVELEVTNPAYRPSEA